MRTLVILTALFVGMLIAPIVFSALYYKKIKVSVLHIAQDKVRDARYFGKSFAAMVRGHIDAAEDGHIRLSRDETYIDADVTRQYEKVTSEMVIAREKMFRPPDPARIFEKEIYSAQNAMILNPESEIRAMYCAKKAVIGDEVAVIRWVDAEDTLAIYDDCDLGISASAGNRLSVGHNCVFRRLYAPVIRIGQYPDSNIDPKEGKNPRIYRLPVRMDKENDVHYISKEMIDDDGIVDVSVISKHNLKITENIIVQGDIRSHRSVRLLDNAVVCGNIFAEGDIYLGRNSAVLGNVFSQGDIHFEERASAGQQGKISSVIARNDITFDGDNFVFGYVSCEKHGKTAELNDRQKKEKKRPAFMTLTTIHGLRHLTFKDVDDYEHVDRQGYRREPELADVVIPDGATKIQKSMFFDCEVLKEAVIPASVTEIEDHAFMDCFSLGYVGALGGSALVSLGVSAFENCRSLKDISLPSSLKTIGGAAFAGCESLRTFTLGADSVLERVGAHCFRGCGSLTEIWLPDTVNYVGVSAFADCVGLRRVSVPETVSGQPGIAELEGSGAEIELREVSVPDDEAAETEKADEV